MKSDRNLFDDGSSGRGAGEDEPRGESAQRVERRLSQLAPQSLSFDAGAILSSTATVASVTSPSRSRPWLTIAVSAACGAVAGALVTMVLQAPAAPRQVHRPGTIVSSPTPSPLAPTAPSSLPQTAAAPPASAVTGRSGAAGGEWLDLRRAVWRSTLTPGQLHQPLTQASSPSANVADTELEIDNSTRHAPPSKSSNVLDSRQLLRELGALPPL